MLSLNQLFYLCSFLLFQVRFFIYSYVKRYSSCKYITPISTFHDLDTQRWVQTSGMSIIYDAPLLFFQIRSMGSFLEIFDYAEGKKKEANTYSLTHLLHWLHRSLRSVHIFLHLKRSCAIILHATTRYSKHNSLNLNIFTSKDNSLIIYS